MDIETLSMALSQQKIQESAAVKVQDMAQKSAEIQGADLVKMMESARVITDPALGSQVNLLA